MSCGVLGAFHVHSCGSPIAFHMIVLWYFLWFACDAEEDDYDDGDGDDGDDDER